MSRAVWSAIDRWIFDAHVLDRESLAILRILWGSFVLLFGVPTARSLALLPPGAYAPPVGPYQLLHAFPPTLFFDIVTAVLSIATIAVLVGYRTRAASVIAGATLLLLIGFESCLGVVHHNRLLMAYLPLVFAWSGWGDRHSVDTRRHPERLDVPPETWPTTMFALMVGFFMLSAGLPKLLGGWPDPSYAATRAAVGLFGGPLAGAASSVESNAIFEALDWATIAFEMGFIAVVNIRMTRAFCAMAVFFHLGIQLVVGIEFVEQAIAYAAFVRWRRFRSMRAIARGLDAALQRIPLAAIAPVVAGLGVSHFVFHRTIGGPLLLVGGPELPGLAMWCASVPFAMGYLLVGIWRPADDPPP